MGDWSPCHRDGMGTRPPAPRYLCSPSRRAPHMAHSHYLSPLPSFPSCSTCSPLLPPPLPLPLLHSPSGPFLPRQDSHHVPGAPAWALRPGFACSHPAPVCCALASGTPDLLHRFLVALLHTLDHKSPHTPPKLPGDQQTHLSLHRESHEQRSLMGYSP